MLSKVQYRSIFLHRKLSRISAIYLARLACFLGLPGLLGLPSLLGLPGLPGLLGLLSLSGLPGLPGLVWPGVCLAWPEPAIGDVVAGKSSSRPIIKSSSCRLPGLA